MVPICRLLPTSVGASILRQLRVPVEHPLVRVRWSISVICIREFVAYCSFRYASCMVRFISSRDREPQTQSSRIQFVQLNDRMSIAHVRAFLFETNRRAKCLRRRIHELSVVGRLEVRSLIFRIGLQLGKRRQFHLVDLGAACHPDQNGLLSECIRVRDCSADTESFAASRPWATIIDWQVFREGWEAGAQWSRDNQCSCMSTNRTSS